MKLSIHHIKWYKLALISAVLSVLLFALGVVMYRSSNPANCSEYGRAVINKIELINSNECAVYYEHKVKGELFQKSEQRKVGYLEESLTIGDSVDVIYACDHPHAGRIIPLQ